MSDNAHYRLARRIDAARGVAETSIDRGDHALANALEGAASAELYTLERAVHDAIHGAADPASFPPHSAVSTPGTFDWFDEFHGFDDTAP